MDAMNIEFDQVEPRRDRRCRRRRGDARAAAPPQADHHRRRRGRDRAARGGLLFRRRRRAGRRAQGQAGRAAPGGDGDRPRPAGHSGPDLGDRDARGPPRHAGRRARAGRPDPQRAGRARPVGPRRPDARRHRSLGPVAAGRAARRPDRGRPRRFEARPEPARRAPSSSSAAASSARRISTRSARPATPPPRACASPRRSSARPAPRSAGSTCARRPRASSSAARSRSARWSAPARRALFRIAEGGEMELFARLPQTDLALLSPGVPVTVTPVGSATSYQGQRPPDRADHRSADPPGRGAHPGPVQPRRPSGRLRPGGDPRRLDQRAAAARIRGADRRSAAPM